MVLRTFKPQELATLLTKDAALRQALGFDRVPHRRTLERRLDATLPVAEAQVQALVQEWLSRVGARVSLGLARLGLSRARAALCPVVSELGGGEHRAD